MTDIEWGPAIAVDGKRPEFVSNGDAVLLPWEDMPVSKSGRAYGAWASGTLWKDIPSLRLPADHPHYRQTEAATGGDLKVSDAHVNASPIDWSGELEAVHEDGRVVAVALGGAKYNPDAQGDHYTMPSLNGGIAGIWRPDGSTWCDTDPGWRIRNVPRPTPQADTKPDLTARMVALVREVDEHGPHAFITKYMAEEARAIVALLPEPVDPLEEAKTVLDVFLAAYQAMPDTTLVERGPDDDLLTYGHLRTILRALAGETGK